MGWALILGLIALTIVYFPHTLTWFAWIVGAFLFLVFIGYLTRPESAKNTSIWNQSPVRKIKSTVSLRQPFFNPQDFEGQVAEIFRSNGYRVIETPYQGDHGIDLKAYKPNELAIVQCKRFTGYNVGESVVRDFFGCMQHEGADIGFIFTTSDFTEPAKKWAEGKRIVLVDGSMVQKMLDEITEKTVSRRAI